MCEDTTAAKTMTDLVPNVASYRECVFGWPLCRSISY